MFVRRFNYLSYILPPALTPSMLSYRDITWAYHSESQVLYFVSINSKLAVYHPVPHSDSGIGCH